MRFIVCVCVYVCVFCLSVFLSVCGCIADGTDCVTVQSNFKRGSFLKIARTLRRSRHGGG